MAQDLASCCARLSVIDGLDVAFPNSSSYTATENAYWSLQEAALTPLCIAKPSSSDDVASIIAAIGNQHCPFAIKSQGHAPAPGFANIDNGITIDLTELNSITTNEDASVAHIETGATWLDVYTHLDSLNKTVAGGRNGGVGVGGLTLGGGISYFSPQIGFTCDSATNFEIVLASGKLIDANVTSHPDLFHALKGGLNNFGVVTRIGFRTLPVGDILGGHVVNDIAYRSEVFKAFSTIADARPYDVHASITTSAIFNAATQTWTLLSAPIYTKPQTSPKVYAELFTIPNVSNTVGITRLHTLANESAIAQTNQLFMTGTYNVSAQLLDGIFDICNDTLHNFTVPGSSQWIITFEPLPTVFVSRGVHNNVLGTSPTDGNGIILLISASWSDIDSSSSIQAKAKQVLGEINTLAEKMGLLREFTYANYAGSFQRPVSSYGVQNNEFLRQVARKYDPRGVFQTQVPGGFKLHG